MLVQQLLSLVGRTSRCTSYMQPVWLCRLAIPSTSYRQLPHIYIYIAALTSQLLVNHLDYLSTLYSRPRRNLPLLQHTASSVLTCPMQLAFGKRPREELYHLPSDPDYMVNLAAGN